MFSWISYGFDAKIGFETAVLSLLEVLYAVTFHCIWTLHSYWNSVQAFARWHVPIVTSSVFHYSLFSTLFDTIGTRLALELHFTSKIWIYDFSAISRVFLSSVHLFSYTPRLACFYLECIAPYICLARWDRNAHSWAILSLITWMPM